MIPAAPPQAKFRGFRPQREHCGGGGQPQMARVGGGLVWEQDEGEQSKGDREVICLPENEVSRRPQSNHEQAGEKPRADSGGRRQGVARRQSHGEQHWEDVDNGGDHQGGCCLSR